MTHTDDGDQSFIISKQCVICVCDIWVKLAELKRFVLYKVFLIPLSVVKLAVNKGFIVDKLYIINVKAVCYKDVGDQSFITCKLYSYNSIYVKLAGDKSFHVSFLLILYVTYVVAMYMYLIFVGLFITNWQEIKASLCHLN